MPGPPRKPSGIRGIQGDQSHRPKNGAEPQVEVGKPPAPRWLTGKGSHAYNELGDRLVEMKVLTPSDKHALALLADAYADYRDLKDKLDSVGVVYETTTQAGDVMFRPRPEVAMCQNAWERVNKMLQQFGLTPAGRSKVQATPETPADPLEEFIRGKKKLRAVK